MANIPKRVEDRQVAGLNKFRTTAAKFRAVNESNLVLILNDTYAELLGYPEIIEINTSPVFFTT